MANRRQWLLERDCFSSAAVPVAIGPTRPASALGSTVSSAARFRSRVWSRVRDESYLREAIENPSATVAVGFPPVMPSFAGQLTEKELQALIEYLKSLSARP